MFRVNEAELLLIQTAVAKSGKGMADWVRDELLFAAGGRERARPHQGAKFMPLKVTRAKDFSQFRVSSEAIAGAMVKTRVPVAAKPSEEGKKPDWWRQLEEDAKLCPGKAPK